MRNNLKITIKWFASIQLLIVATLITLHILTVYLFYTSEVYSEILFDQFNLNKEKNIPTAYQVLALWCAAYMIGIIAFHLKKMKKQFVTHWFILSAIFFFLGLDEATMIHDALSQPVRELLNSPDTLYFAWVIPYAILVLVFVIAYLKFYFHFSLKFKILFGLSGFIYVFGALGMEVIGSSRMANFGGADLQYVAFMTIEESLELIGILLLNITLFSYLKEKVQAKDVSGFFTKYDLL